MKGKIILSVLSLAISGSIFAEPASPNKCPASDQVRSAGLEKNIVEQDRSGYWAVARLSAKYDTNYDWTFVVGKIQAGGPDDAFNKATASLASLQFLNGPQYMQQIGRWVCRYTTSQGYAAVAVTPVIPGKLSLIPSI